jgi:RND family efflux transporter MFP subunit
MPRIPAKLIRVRPRLRRAARLAAILPAAITLSCGGNRANPAQGAGGPHALPVKVQVTQAVPVSDTSEYVATLRSRDSAVIMPQVEGQITEIYVHSGDHVAPGKPLMQIDPAHQQAALKTQQDTVSAKRAELNWDKQQFDRTSALYKSGVASKQDLDQAQSTLDTAEAQLAALQAQVRQETVQLHYYKVTAPSSGIVGDIPVRVGDRVTTSTLLTTVDKPGSLEAYIYIPIERAAQLRIGLPVHIVDSAGNPLAESRISFISPEVDNTTQSVLAKASITNSNDKLRTLQFIRARIVWGTHTGPVVPVLAVSRLGGQYFVFVAEEQNGKVVAHQKALQVGDMMGNNYVVKDGLKAGDKVIVSGTQFLVDGVPVAPQG